MGEGNIFEIDLFAYVPTGDVSLGYNVSREKVEKVLIEAAENAGLEEKVEGE